jgi:hypothetical protein
MAYKKVSLVTMPWYILWLHTEEIASRYVRVGVTVMNKQSETNDE